jgi:hypothetical protein
MGTKEVPDMHQAPGSSKIKKPKKAKKMAKKSAKRADAAFFKGRGKTGESV